MPTVNTGLNDLFNETAAQQARNAQALREESYTGKNRNIGGEMGKNDFLLLLATQLRYQDPLNPSSDTEFAAQLAQFSALEQMQNMNTTLEQMATYQAFSLLGQRVIADAVVDGVPMIVAGIVDSVFTREGVTYAQVGEYVVPVSTITDVFDSSSFLTSDSFINTSNNLIGRTVRAQVGEDEFIEGVVTRVEVTKSSVIAHIDDGSGELKTVPVSSIIDIGITPAPKTEGDGDGDGGDGDGDGDGGDDD